MYCLGVVYLEIKLNFAAWLLKRIIIARVVVQKAESENLRLVKPEEKQNLSFLLKLPKYQTVALTVSLVGHNIS